MTNATQLPSDKYGSSVGDTLRHNREQLGLSLEEVSQRLRIRLVFLQALEDGRIDQLPGIAYASGFLRAYAELLKLDSDVLVTRFRHEHQGSQEKPKLMFPAPVPHSGVPAGVMVFFSILIVIGAYIGWYKITDHHKVPAETIPDASKVMHDGQQNTDIHKMSPQIASVMPSEHPAPLPKEMQQGNENIPPSQVTSPAQPPSQAQLPTAGIPDWGKETKENPNTEKTEPKQQPDNAKQEKDQKVFIIAHSSSWLLVKDKLGHVLYQNTLKAGERWELPQDQPEVIMTIGNPSGIIVEKGDKQSAPLGKKGKSLRRFVLNAKRLEKLLSVSEAPGGANSTDTQSKVISPPVVKTNRLKPALIKPKHKEMSADDLNAKQLNR
ncbi:helix-turn-helix domain-containing protein [Commensalibacter oyaizuii]|uniref:DUF4115 domain-containing protein n=1 Tax=Commensalibacter oyaizuii TaxID=3043873 RepID=A0ABT6Q1C4_9PROT|nr:helix-turn-helix domain-containing protein [Commensalibacter sp. TBRC 16381]MDI2090805.1 DUF4115 domain-containing protein [Commensalibacter sp. TBRC 16381]